MSKKLVIFGTSELAQVLKFHIDKELEYDLIAFCVDNEYFKEKALLGIPVMPFSIFLETFACEDVFVIVAIGYSKLNATRTQLYNRLKHLGYRFTTYISPTSKCYADYVGENTIILEDNLIEPYTTIGNNVIIWAKNTISHHCKILDNVFISSHVDICGKTTIQNNTFIGANTIIADHIEVGKKCIIGAGCKIFKNLRDDSLVLETGTRISKMSAKQFINLDIMF